jgi:multicomponent Na+:H+ antiporter subunit C
MSLIYAAAVAITFGCGVYLLLSRHVMRMTFGIMLMSAAVNLVIFLAGRLDSQQPPVIRAGETALQQSAANPLPQALVLTAIVIGFSLVAFLAALALRAFRDSGAANTRQLNQAEELGSPHEQPGSGS